MIDLIKSYLRASLGSGERGIKLVVVNGGVSVRSKLVCLCWVGGAQEPGFVVKFPRYPMYNHRVQAEYEALQQLQPHLPPGANHASRPILTKSIEGLLVTVETATRGRMLRAYLSEHTGAYREELENLKPFSVWLGELHLRSSKPAHSEELEKWIFEPLRSAPNELGLSETERASLTWLREKAVELCERLSLPGVFNHNDPGTPNILVDKAGCFTGIIDWESGGYGLPATDLIYFLGRYAYETRDLGRCDQLRGYREMFFPPNGPKAGAFDSGLAREWLRDYCNQVGVALEWIPVLFALCWVMHARNERNHLLSLMSEGQMLMGKPGGVTHAGEEEMANEGHFRSLLRFFLENLHDLDVGLDLPHAPR